MPFRAPKGTRDVATAVGGEPDLGTVRALYADGLSPGDLIREVYRRVQAKPDVGVWIALVRSMRRWRGRSPRSPRPREPASLRGAVVGQGQHRREGAADHRRLSGLRPPARKKRHRRPAHGGRRRHPGRQEHFDQFATGLVGIRSPVHPVNSFDAARIPAARVPARRLPSRSASSASIRHLFMVDTHSPRNDRGWHKRRQPCPTPSRRCRASSLRRP